MSCGAWLAAVVLDASRVDVDRLASRDPRETALMRQRRLEAGRKRVPYRVDQRWVPYERISPTLRRAVLIAEDDRFYSHAGLDWHEIGEAARHNLEKRRLLRGGSTITQQLARNVFLGNERTLTRKLKEIVLAYRMEGALSKRRILELYLNLIEWGDGIYGAEAAAHRYFGAPAAALDERQSALLAAVIINPRRFSPLDPSRRVERRVRLILTRMARRGFLAPRAIGLASDSVISPPMPLADSGAGLPWPEALPPAPEPSDSVPAGDSAGAPDTSAAP